MSKPIRYWASNASVKQTINDQAQEVRLCFSHVDGVQVLGDTLELIECTPATLAAEEMLSALNAIKAAVNRQMGGDMSVRDLPLKQIADALKKASGK